MSRTGATRNPYRLFAPVLLLLVANALVAVIGLSEAGGSDPVPAGADTARTARTEKRAPRSVTIGWVGDTVLGSRHGVPPDGGRDLLAGVRSRLKRPDVMVGNLEGVIGTRGVAKCPPQTPNCFAFQAPPEAARTLAWAGFDVLNLANNHANDYGPLGLQDSRRHLRDAGLAHTGAPGQVTLVRRDGITVAVLGFAAYPWAARLDDVPAAVKLVRQAGEQADVVVVTMHAGAEGTDQVRTPTGREIAYGEDRGDTRGFARAVVDAGADVVFGSGPHVIRGVELRRGAPIVYSTGNFAGYHTFPTTGVLALAAMVQVTVDARGRVRDGRWTPIRIVPPGRPTVDSELEESTRLAAELSRTDFSKPGLRASGRLRTTTGR